MLSNGHASGGAAFAYRRLSTLHAVNNFSIQPHPTHALPRTTLQAPACRPLALAAFLCYLPAPSWAGRGTSTGQDWTFVGAWHLLVDIISCSLLNT